MVTVEQCATFAKLASNELFLGARPSARHRTLLLFYLQDLGTLGLQQVREIIVAEIRVALSLGAVRQAADLLIVLRQFFSEYPEASLAAAPAHEGRHSHRPLSPGENRSSLSSRRTSPVRGSNAPRRLA